MFASVGKKYGFTGTQVQAIYRRNDAEADRRLKARGDAEGKALETQCGSRPAISALDGGSRAAEEYVKRSAHAPSSVERCTEPKVNPGTCWTMTCDVLATNALGAKVLNQVRFSVRQGTWSAPRSSRRAGRWGATTAVPWVCVWRPSWRLPDAEAKNCSSFANESCSFLEVTNSASLHPDSNRRTTSAQGARTYLVPPASCLSALGFLRSSLQNGWTA